MMTTGAVRPRASPVLRRPGERGRARLPEPARSGMDAQRPAPGAKAYTASCAVALADSGSLSSFADARSARPDEGRKGSPSRRIPPLVRPPPPPPPTAAPWRSCCPGLPRSPPVLRSLRAGEGDRFRRPRDGDAARELLGEDQGDRERRASSSFRSRSRTYAVGSNRRDEGDCERAAGVLPLFGEARAPVPPARGWLLDRADASRADVDGDTEREDGVGDALLDAGRLRPPDRPGAPSPSDGRPPGGPNAAP